MLNLKKLIGNRVTEKELRDYLTDQGYDGKAAKFDRLELEAIQRPGWIQVFAFEVRLLDDHDRWVEFFGVVRDDERHRMQVHLTESEIDRDLRLKKWSVGLLTREAKPLTKTHKWLLALFGVVMLFALVSAVLSGA